MGNVPSTQKLARVIPNVHSTWDNSKTEQVFRNSEDRDQFIHSILSLVSNNEKVKVEDNDFQLLYVRKPQDRIVATLVMSRGGVIQSKIMPPNDGENSLEAFLEFKKYVESRMHELLQTVPEAAASAGASNSRANDLPPSYDNAATTKPQGGAKR